MATKKKKSGGGNRSGPKLKEATFSELKKMAGYGMTRDEMADVLGMCRTTLYERIKADPMLELAIKQGTANMAMSIRRKQVTEAKAGNTTMLVWLGKQYLDQKEKIDTVEHHLPPEIEAMLAGMTKEELLTLAGLQPTGSAPEVDEDSGPADTGTDT